MPLANYLAPLLLIATQAAPQEPTTTGMIVGQVIDAGTGRPAAGAVVTISGPPPQQSGVVQISTPRILTSSDGRFVFRGLRRGIYSITLTRGRVSLSRSSELALVRAAPKAPVPKR